MLHNPVSDKFLEAILAFLCEIMSDWKSLDMAVLEPKMQALKKSVHLAYISNQNARQFILAVYLNKLRFRSFVLDLAVGCQESKKILKTTSFYTLSLFGPFPESFSARLESAFSAS